MLTNAKLNISIDGETISQVTTMKYLGIDIDSNLNWNNHIDRICKQFHPKSDYWGASADCSNCRFN